MLKNLVRKNRRLFESIAQAWLDEGAQAVVLEGTSHKRIATWPADSALLEDAHPVMSAAIELGNQPVGSLCIIGLNGGANQARLTYETRLLKKWLALEEEISSLTGQLIEYQDQILLLYDLSQGSRHQLQREPTIATYLATGRQLLQVEQLILVEGHPDKPGQPPADWLQILSDPQPLNRTRERDRLLEKLHCAQKIALLRRPFGEASDDSWRHVMALPVDGQANGPATLVALNRQLGPFGTPTQKMGAALVDLLGAELERLALHEQILDQTRLETEAAMARTVQMQLLPGKAPTVTGLDVYGSSKPALQVGGDYYDFLKLSESELFFTLADVSGKGMPAALSMTNLRSAIRTAVRLLPSFELHTVLRQSNDALYEDFADVEMFATIFCGYFNHADRLIRFSNGGHAPVIYRPVGGPARMVRANGPALGVMRDGPIGTGELPFGAGDLLVAATDGFNESENAAGQMFGYDRLVDLIDSLSHRSAAEIATILNEEVMFFRGDEPQQDDQTIVVLKGITP